MNKYFYTNGISQLGPYTAEELKGKNITPETQVWSQHLGEWKPAGSVLELNDLFALTPAENLTIDPTDSNDEGIHLQRPPKTWLLESILATIIFCPPFGIAGIVNAAKVESRFNAGDIQGAHRAAAQAKKWTTVSVVVALAFILLFSVFGWPAGY
ncbi:MAG TPA: hypothetical protein DCL77_01640 [Prolixibacteraceae bacterium]|nr:hypothetical protein [Prolixibacteraceae bacterium]